ncbi:MAG: hypothetical protein HW398_75 [Acidobacteria bacterium]|nr:hypothetical protein [Acidobacteriota bacterium]
MRCRANIFRLALTGAILLTAACNRQIRLAPLPLARGGEASVRVAAYTRYVLWVATPDRQTVVNAGQIRVDENRKAEMQTLTPLRDFVVFITAEARGDVTSPGPDMVFQSEAIHW